MKGPGLRLSLDVRRLWRCPSCGAERRTGGERTTVGCHQCANGRLMHLVDRERPPRHAPRPLDLVIAYEPDDLSAEEHAPMAAELIDTLAAVARLEVTEPEVIDAELIAVEVIESLVDIRPMTDTEPETDAASIEPENLTEPSPPGAVTVAMPEHRISAGSARSEAPRSKEETQPPQQAPAGQTVAVRQRRGLGAQFSSLLLNRSQESFPLRDPHFITAK